LTSIRDRTITHIRRYPLCAIALLFGFAFAQPESHAARLSFEPVQSAPRAGEVSELAIVVTNPTNQFAVLYGVQVTGPGVRQLFDPVGWYQLPGPDTQPETVEHMMILSPAQACTSHLAAKFLKPGDIKLRFSLYYRLADWDSLKANAFAHGPDGVTRESLDEGALRERIARHEGVALREPGFGEIAYFERLSSQDTVRVFRVGPGEFDLKTATARVAKDVNLSGDALLAQSTYCTTLKAWMLCGRTSLDLVDADTVRRFSHGIDVRIFDYLDAARYLHCDSIILTIGGDLPPQHPDTTRPADTTKASGSGPQPENRTTVNGVALELFSFGWVRREALDNVVDVVGRLSGAMEQGMDFSVSCACWPPMLVAPPPYPEHN